MASNELEKRIFEGLNTAFIDYSLKSNLAYRPEFISNDFIRGKKVLSSIEQELECCNEFIISVAFITKGGITPLLQTLKELEQKGIKGKILTTDYLCFSEPDALDTLASLSNIELKMFMTNSESGGFHTKGYIFREDETYRVIIGSSNLTQSALTKNREWNTKLVSSVNGEIVSDIINEFNQLWASNNSIKYQDFIEQYKDSYQKNQIIREQRANATKGNLTYLETYKLEPNKMQVAFVRSLLKIVNEDNKNKALLLSATGTGKTYASAFGVRELGAKKVLIITHREQILKQSIEKYQRVFGPSFSYGLISGNSREYTSDFVFATMNMMAKDEILSKFSRNNFDVIILDECHHSGNNSYQHIMSYFTPKLWLGMTASPDTIQYDIYSIFDHNIAYEIRLQQALEEDLLCPFHYFGIKDLEIDGEVFDDETQLRNFNKLVSDERVNHIIDKINYYGYSGNRVKGLIFCRTIDEAIELSNKFNSKKKNNGEKYRTKVLTGNDTQDVRDLYIDLLTTDDTEDYLDYIFSVDIFNEGIDIPEVNQVIMLRPTQSPVIFVQQLGRGLRKNPGKEYVVIIDFIANYKNNYLIPIALSGDKTYNKDTIRKYVSEGNRIIPGASTIHFDEISKKRIYNSIDSARTNTSALIKTSYTELKHKLGRIPSIMEFKTYGMIDIKKIFEKYGSYHEFLKKYENEYTVDFNEDQSLIIQFLSSKVSQYKRIHDLCLLKYLMSNESCNINTFEAIVKDDYNSVFNDHILKSVINNLTQLFPTSQEKKKYSKCVLIDYKNRNFTLTKYFSDLLEDPLFADQANEILDYGISEYNDEYKENYKDSTLCLYKKYTYEDVCRLLNFNQNMTPLNIGGYYYDSETKTLPVFINYNKDANAIDYPDRFIPGSNMDIIASSKHPRDITSSDADHIYKRTEEDKNNRIYMFIRKNKDDQEAKEFYFLGEVFAQGDPDPIILPSDGSKAFEIKYRFDLPVKKDLYDYIVKD